MRGQNEFCRADYVYFRHQPVQPGRMMVAINKNAEAHTLALARFQEMLAPGMQAFDPLSGRRFALGGTLELPVRGVLVLELTR